MSLTGLVGIALFGGLGSGLRHLVDRMVSTRFGDRFPWGTIVVNVTGSFALGLLTGAMPSSTWRSVLGVGLLGGYTTFSAASVEAVALLGDDRRLPALAHSAGMLIAAVVAAAAGLHLTGA